METQYAHSLLFACPNCQFPIVIGCLSIRRNLEGIDAENFAATCASCRRSYNLPGVTAKKHYVDEWPYAENVEKKG